MLICPNRCVCYWLRTCVNARAASLLPVRLGVPAFADEDVRPESGQRDRLLGAERRRRGPDPFSSRPRSSGRVQEAQCFAHLLRDCRWLQTELPHQIVLISVIFRKDIGNA